MMHLYEDDHIKDVKSTCRGSCNTRMECWWWSTSSTLGSCWYFTPVSALCTQWGPNKACLSFLFLPAGLLWSRQAGKKNPSDGHKKSIQRRTKLNKVAVCLLFSRFPLKADDEGGFVFLRTHQILGGWKKHNFMESCSCFKKQMYLFLMYLFCQGHIFCRFSNHYFSPQTPEEEARMINYQKNLPRTSRKQHI